MKPLDSVFDEMSADDVPSWDTKCRPTEALSQIASSATDWLLENHPDATLAVVDAGDAEDGDDFLRITLRRGDETAERDFKVGVAPD